jgi:hypothetical protein
MGRLVLHWVCVCALVALPVGGCSDESGGAAGNGGSGGDGGTGGVGGTGGISCIDGEPTVTLLATIRDRDLDQDLEGVRVCETDTDNCQVTNAEGRAFIELPCEQEVSYTLEKEGYVSGLWLDVTDETFQGFSLPMNSDAQVEEWSEILMLPEPWTGGAIALIPVPRRAGVTFELVGQTAQAVYRDEEGIPDPTLTATTSTGIGNFFEVPAGEYQVEYGGDATNCVPREAWPGDAANRTKVPVKVGFITYVGMSCDPQ